MAKQWVTEKPPLGITPRWLWCEHRCLELARAMVRAADSGTPGNAIHDYSKEVRDVLNFSEAATPWPVIIKATEKQTPARDAMGKTK